MPTLDPKETKSDTNGTFQAPSLNLDKLTGLPPEQRDLYILTFSADLARFIASLDADTISKDQAALKKELVQLISLPSPAPTRAIRNNIGRCFAVIFGRGNRKLLYESINELVAIVTGGKDKTQEERHAATHCLGEIFGAAGDSAISLSGLACVSLLKQLKPAQNHVGYRSSIYKALGKLFAMVGGSADEAVARDVWTHARKSSFNEKAALVQKSAAWCLEQLVRCTPYFDNMSDFDSLRTSIFKAIDSPYPTVRHAGASCLASAFIKNFVEDLPSTTAVRPKKPKKKQSGTEGQDEDVDAQRPQSSEAKRPAQRLSFSLLDILKQLSAHYTRTSTTNRVRAGIAVSYTKFFKRIGEQIVETQYAKIVDHLFMDILSHPTIVFNRYRLLTARKSVRVILEDVIGRQILSETGQLAAAKILINDFIKNYPQVIKERPEPSKYVLTGVLSTLASLIGSLGAAMNSLAHSCQEGLLQVLQHGSYTVQIATSHCLQAFVLACPQQLLPCITICMNKVKREVDHLGGPRYSPRRCVGNANGLAAVVSTAPLQPLYGSVEINARVFSLATDLLKSSGESELRISSTQVQVAWILIGGLMPLGPNFVKIHLSQLLLLWKNSLPKPMPKENMAQRSLLELSFLAHVRECVLGSILAFLKFNSKLLTTDVSKRIAMMLQNTTVFLNSLPARRVTDDHTQRLSPSIQLLDLDLMVRRRVLQAYTQLVNLSPSGAGEALLHSNLLTLAVSFFADPDQYTPSSLSTSIASSAGNFENVWEVGDQSGFGITGLVHGFEIRSLPGEQFSVIERHRFSPRGSDGAIDECLIKPVLGAREHDSIRLYTGDSRDQDNLPDPPATEVVNSAIELFAVALPLQAPKIQESMLEQVATFLSASSLHRDPGRKAAMTVNIATALLVTLMVAVKETGSAAGDLRSSAVERAIQEMLRGFVIQPDPFVRNIGIEALSRLCDSSGNAFTANEINYLVDMIVTNRDPNARAGCAYALSCILAQVGGMAAGFHIKTVHGILTSLGTDPHPTVHFWAMEALAIVADSSGLTFAAYVSSTLGTIGQLYVSDTHNEEVAVMGPSNLEIEFPTSVAISRCTDALINVLGPDLQDMAKERDLILTLVAQFQMEEDPSVLLVSLKCFEHLSLYASGNMGFATYVRQLQKHLIGKDYELRDVAIDGLFNLMRRDAEEVISNADPGLEDQLWLALDDNPNHAVIRSLFRNWLEHTGLLHTASWLQRLQKTFTKVRYRQGQPQFKAKVAKTLEQDLQDEEVAGFAASAGANEEDATNAPGSGQEPLKWQVRTLAMSLLFDLLEMVSQSILADEDSLAEAALQQRVAEVIRMAFSASTAHVVELRVWGLRIIDQVLKIFGKTPDPDFAEASLLEQYQAQISSALTPAFAIDSSPELASEAIHVCGGFIATGIVTDVERMGRILKLLVTALENFSNNSQSASVGDLQGLSSNAQVMVKTAILSAWAELQVSSLDQKYLIEVVAPHVAKLTPLWLESLQEFARLRFEPDISMNNGPPSLTDSPDVIYSAMSRETLLKFYQDSWLSLVDAIASLIEQDSEFVFDALDGKTSVIANGTDKKHEINYRDEPVAFFFVLFGIAFEALASRSGHDSLATEQQNLEILKALKKILRPSVSGQAIYQDVVFSETMDLLDRLVLTEGLDVQTVIVEIARDMCITHPSARRASDSTANDSLSEDIDQLFELTRIIVLVIAGLLPNLGETKSLNRHQLSDEAVTLIRLSLDALIDAAEVFPSVIKADLHACVFHIFSVILGTGSAQAIIVPQSLPILKRYIGSITKSTSHTVATQVRGCLARFLAILVNAQKRETEASLPCVKNTLLSATILLTGGVNLVPPNDPLLIKFLDELVDCLSDRMTAIVASNCIRSLLLHTPRSPSDEYSAAYLLPHLLALITETDTEDPVNARALVAHGLVAFAGTLERSQLPKVLSALIPALLTRAGSVGSEVYQETASRFLELAAVDGIVFRAVVGRLDGEQRGLLEEVLRSRGQITSEHQGEKGHEEEPTIRLTMDFGDA